MKSTLEILRDARAVIEDERRWGIGRMCDAEGRHCAAGAVIRAAWGNDGFEGPSSDFVVQATYEKATEMEAMKLLAQAVREKSPLAAFPASFTSISFVTVFNDTRLPLSMQNASHAKVLALFDRAIELAEEREAEVLTEHEFALA